MVVKGVFMLVGFFILLVFYFLGEFISYVGMLPIPGSVIGMLLLLTFLIVRQGAPHSVLKISSVLLKNLSLLFIPVCTGMVFYVDMLASQWWVLLVSIIVSSAIAIVAIVWVMRACLSLQRSKMLSGKPLLERWVVNNG